MRAGLVGLVAVAGMWTFAWALARTRSVRALLVLVAAGVGVAVLLWVGT